MLSGVRVCRKNNILSPFDTVCSELVEGLGVKK